MLFRYREDRAGGNKHRGSTSFLFLCFVSAGEKREGMRVRVGEIVSRSLKVISFGMPAYVFFRRILSIRARGRVRRDLVYGVDLFSRVLQLTGRNGGRDFA